MNNTANVKCWKPNYCLMGVVYYPGLIELTANSLAETMDSIEAIIKSAVSPKGYYNNSNDFIDNNCFRKKTRITTSCSDEVTQTGAFVITTEGYSYDGSMHGSEAVYVVKKKDDIWEIKCIDFYKISSEGPYLRLLVGQIIDGILTYDKIGISDKPATYKIV